MPEMSFSHGKDGGVGRKARTDHLRYPRDLQSEHQRPSDQISQLDAPFPACAVNEILLTDMFNSYDLIRLLVQSVTPRINASHQQHNPSTNVSIIMVKVSTRTCSPRSRAGTTRTHAFQTVPKFPCPNFWINSYLSSGPAEKSGAPAKVDRSRGVVIRFEVLSPSSR
jgi:hypothetical protein